MKKIVLIIFIVILGFTSCKNKSNSGDYNVSHVNNERVEFAKSLSDKILTAQKNGNYYNLSEDEANSKMINGLNETLQKSSYNQIKKMYGDYKSLNL